MGFRLHSVSLKLAFDESECLHFQWLSHMACERVRRILPPALQCLFLCAGGLVCHALNGLAQMCASMYLHLVQGTPVQNVRDVQN